MQALNERLVRQQLASDQACHIHLFEHLASTNTWLLERCKQLSGRHICAAERQTQGRGRRGKCWQSPPTGVTFSLYQAFELLSSQLSGLSLVTACALVEALETFDTSDLALKWPNDVLVDGKKLAGILIELSAQGSISHIITGIGINFSGVGNQGAIDQPFIDLEQILTTRLPNRSVLIGTVCEAVFNAYDSYRKSGLAPFIGQWSRYDAYANRRVNVVDDSGRCSQGIARGINAQGAYCIETQYGLQAYYAGEVSVRLQP